MKKILLLLMTLLFLFSSVNAVEYLNSCGKSSGWVASETYILNFTSIPSSYSNNYCFRMVPIVGDTNNIIIQGTNQTIINNKEGLRFFSFGNPGGNGFLKSWIWKDFKFHDNEDIINSYLLYSESGSYYYLWYHDFINIELNMYMFFSGSSSTQFKWSDFTNVTLILDTATSSSWYSWASILVHDSVIDIDNFANFGATYDGSIIKGFPHVDLNDDGLADSDLYAGKTSMRVTHTILGNEYIQDFEEGIPFIDSGDNIVLIENNQIGNPDIVLIDEFTNIDTSLSLTLFDNINGFQMGDYSSLCYDPINGRCFYQDHSTPFNYALEYKGLVRVGDYTTVENIDFNKIYSTNNAHLISNPTDTLLTNININDNNFLKADDQFKFLDNYLIKLNANNVLIKNNIFNMSTSANNGYEVIQILGNDKWSNDITENEFLLNAPSATTPSYVFTNNSRTKFYNNYLDSNVEVHSDFNINIVQNPIVSYETGGVIYYWTIGNYYVDNVGCTDGDSNGICDSSYTIGNYTDYFPLASYPFVYTDHLLTADSTATIGTYNVTLTNITEGETVNLVDGTETLIFGFTQDSDYPDLQCGYYLDAINFGGVSNPPKDTINPFQKVGGWTTKTYALRVDCSNAQGTFSSGDTNFNVILSALPNVCGNAILEGAEQCDDGNTLNGDGCSSICQFEVNVSAICGNGIWELPEQCDDGNLLNGDGCSSICETEIVEPEVNETEPIFLDLNLFGDDIEESGNNLNEVLKLAEQPLGWGIILGMAFIGIALIGGVFAIVGIMFR
ncbi:MAG: myxococcus cysteine-rich repeat containing protein [Candidatus Helarchaeota archaeon]